MADARKSEEAMRRIQDLKRRISAHESNIARFEREKVEKLKFIDQQIKREQDQIKQLSRDIEESKRHI
jgi:hypothetical protein